MGWDYLIQRVSDAHFNTKKVRLKQLSRQVRLALDLPADFNTKKVRLKLWIYAVVNDHTIQHFNTKKVRLKRLQYGGAPLQVLHYFNTKKVRLKRGKLAVNSASATISIPKRCD